MMPLLCIFYKERLWSRTTVYCFGGPSEGWYASAAVRLDASPDHTDGKVVVFLTNIEHHISLGLIGEDDLVEIEFETDQPQKAFTAMRATR